MSRLCKCRVAPLIVVAVVVITTVLLTPSVSKAADMAHLCVPQNQALGVCRGFVPDIQICGTHGREDPVNATIISNAEEEVVITVIMIVTTTMMIIIINIIIAGFSLLL